MKNEEILKHPISPSKGMRSILEDRHTTFRVWAPNADMVFATDDFNKWTDDDFKLDQEENGSWAGTTAQAKEGDQHKYLIKNGRNYINA